MAAAAPAPAAGNGSRAKEHRAAALVEGAVAEAEAQQQRHRQQQWPGDAFPTRPTESMWLRAGWQQQRQRQHNEGDDDLIGLPADDDAADAELATGGAAVALLLCTMKRPHVVQLGLERGYISPDAEFGGITLTHIAGEDVELLRCLVDKGANVNRDNGKGGTPLHARSRTSSRRPRCF